jgi:hypothetical protein
VQGQAGAERRRDTGRDGQKDVLHGSKSLFRGRVIGNRPFRPAVAASVTR